MKNKIREKFNSELSTVHVGDIQEILEIDDVGREQNDVIRKSNGGHRDVPDGDSKSGLLGHVKLLVVVKFIGI